MVGPATARLVFTPAVNQLVATNLCQYWLEFRDGDVVYVPHNLQAKLQHSDVQIYFTADSDNIIRDTLIKTCSEENLALCRTVQNNFHSESQQHSGFVTRL